MVQGLCGETTAISLLFVGKLTRIYRPYFDAQINIKVPLGLM